MAAEMADISPGLREELEMVFARIQSRLQKGLSAMKVRKELRSDANPKSLAQFAVASLQGGLLLSKTTKTTGELRNVLNHTLTYLRSFARVS